MTKASTSKRLLDETLLVGQEVYIKPRGSAEWEARIVCAHVSGTEYLSLSPVLDILHEDFGATGCRIEPREPNEPPPPLIGKKLLDFADWPEEQEFAEFVATAESLKENLLGARGIDPHAPLQDVNRRGGYLKPAAAAGRLGVPPTQGRAPALPDGAGGVGGGGQRPVLTGGLAALSAALGNVRGQDKAPADAEPADDRPDVRVLPVSYDVNGLRWREFRSASDVSVSHVWPDWPIPGPRTAGWCMKWFVSHGGSPMSWHSMWKANGKLTDTEPLVLEHESLTRVIETMCTYDQFDLASSASGELLCRQLQIIEDRLSYKFDDETAKGSDYFLMSGAASRTNVCVCPELKTWIASEISKESGILKERRKAREERALAAPKGKAKST